MFSFGSQLDPIGIARLPQAQPLGQLWSLKKKKKMAPAVMPNSIP